MRTDKHNQRSKKPLPGFAGGAKQPPLPEHFQEKCVRFSGSKMRQNKPEHALDDLRAQIRRIEQGQTPFPENGVNWLSRDQTPSPARSTTGFQAKKHATADRLWNFGIPEIDEVLPGNELSRAALHEIKPATYRDTHAALGFAMALVGRRAISNPNAALLFCLPPFFSNEFGAPYGPGLCRLMPRPENCLIAQPKTHAHLLWAMEEGLSAGAFALVLATLKTLEPTPARRLSLRAGAGRTPGLLLTHHDTTGINMAETRWRIKRGQSDAGGHLAIAPGRTKWTVILERAPNGKGGLKWIMEWRHETLSFTLASPLADRTPQTARTGTSPGFAT